MMNCYEEKEIEEAAAQAEVDLEERERVMREALMYDIADAIGIDVNFNGTQYELRFRGKPDMHPLCLTHLDDVFMTLEAFARK